MYDFECRMDFKGGTPHKNESVQSPWKSILDPSGLVYILRGNHKIHIQIHALNMGGGGVPCQGDFYLGKVPCTYVEDKDLFPTILACWLWGSVGEELIWIWNPHDTSLSPHSKKKKERKNLMTLTSRSHSLNDCYLSCHGQKKGRGRETASLPKYSYVATFGLWCNPWSWPLWLCGTVNEWAGWCQGLVRAYWVQAPTAFITTIDSWKLLCVSTPNVKCVWIKIE